MLTIGHSTLPIGQFVALLTANGCKTLGDIRAFPRSRRNPQFNFDALPEALAPAGILYVPLPGLGGLRKAIPDSPNTGWRNLSFRGYADYMQTPEFMSHLNQLLELPGPDAVALMCAEALPWRCHRSLVADALTVRGIPVWHIMSSGPPKPHTLTSFAETDGVRIIYPAPSLGLPY